MLPEWMVYDAWSILKHEKSGTYVAFLAGDFGRFGLTGMER
jgi:hypothetical protein